MSHISNSLISTSSSTEDKLKGVSWCVWLEKHQFAFLFLMAHGSGPLFHGVFEIRIIQLVFKKKKKKSYKTSNGPFAISGAVRQTGYGETEISHNVEMLTVLFQRVELNTSSKCCLSFKLLLFSSCLPIALLFYAVDQGGCKFSCFPKENVWLLGVHHY